MLLDEFAYKPEGDVEKVKAVIDAFAIADDQKADMREMVTQLCQEMRAKFNSIRFGKSLRCLSGCAQVIDDCEVKLVRTPDEQEERLGVYTQDSVLNWYDELMKRITWCIDLDEPHRKNLLRYVLYAQQFEECRHDYRRLFEEYDKLI